MRLLVAVVRRGGLAAASEDLSMTPSAVSRGLARLEARLGVRLLERTTRRVALTPEGERFYEASRRILADIEETEVAVAASRGRPHGLLRVNSGVAFAVHQLARALPTFRGTYPEVELELSVTDQIIDPVAENVDLTIRTGSVMDDRLVGRAFTQFRRIICAAPDYLEQKGWPRQPRDLFDHDCINVASTPHLSRWPFRGENGVEFLEPTRGLRIDNAEAVLALGLAGGGIVRLGDVVVSESIRAGLLVPLLADFNADETQPILAVFAPGRQRLPKVRVFLDFLAETFGHVPWRLS